MNPSTEEFFTEIAVGSKADVDEAFAAARQVRVNYPNWDAGMPFGGYKQSGNDGEFGLDDFTGIKGIAGYFPE